MVGEDNVKHEGFTIMQKIGLRDMLVLPSLSHASQSRNISRQFFMLRNLVTRRWFLVQQWNALICLMEKL